MKQKIVPVTVPVAAAFFAKASPLAARLGINARKHIGQVMASITLHQLQEDLDLWLTTVVFPSRKAAQFAVNAYFEKSPAALMYRHQEVSFVEHGTPKYERFYAPGAKQSEQKQQRLMEAWRKADEKAATARKAAASVAGFPIANPSWRDGSAYIDANQKLGR